MFIRLLLFILLTFISFRVSGAPEIAVIGKVKADLGKFETRETRKASFTITNKGDEKLIVTRIRATCNCGVVDISKKELDPGEKAILKIQTTPYDLEGNFSKSIYVETNDPGQRFTQLLLVGNAVPLMEIKPKNMVYAGTLKPGQYWKYTFTLKSVNDKPVIPEAPFTESNQSARASLHKVSETEYQVMVEIKAGTASPSLKTTVKIPVKQPENWADMEIMIAGKVAVPEKDGKRD